MARPRLKDVAALAEISTATASRAITHKGFVAPETRDRVLQAMKSLNYHPNLRARGLRQQSSRTIGLVINYLNPANTALADTMIRLSAARGYHLVIAPTQDDDEAERRAILDMVGQDVDGLLWIPTAPSQDLLDLLAQQRIPAVAVVRRVPNDVIDTVVIEDHRGSFMATQHLINLGHHRIAYLGGENRHSSNHARWQGYLDALASAGIEPDSSLVRSGPYGGTWGDATIAELLRHPSSPTAVFVASNAFMPAFIKMLRQFHVSVPAALSLVAFDDVDWFSFIEPPVTAVNISYRRLAEAAVDLVLRRLEDPAQAAAQPAFVQVTTELLLRGSTGPARQGPLVLHNDVPKW